MNNKGQFLTHSEVMEGLTYCFRELLATEISHRNMPNIINRAKASAAVVTSAHREELMEMKRQGGLMALKSAENVSLKKLKPNTKTNGTNV